MRLLSVGFLPHLLKKLESVVNVVGDYRKKKQLNVTQENWIPFLLLPLNFFVALGKTLKPNFSQVVINCIFL